MGQFIQQGERLMFETVVRFDKAHTQLTIPDDPENVDGLNFLSGKSMAFVAERALQGVTLAHVDGGVPNILLTAPARDERSLGALIYFFEFACGVSGYLLGVNPFDQPGVEAYKNNMYALLGKPGYEKQKGELEKRLES
jgi:glucose-6-phosphate isomerase